MISIIIPCRNEKKYIAKCLDSIIAGTYLLKDQIEILIVDGMSDDGTREIIEHYLKSYSFIIFLDNVKKITPAALNIGIAKAKGEIILRMDAHVVYPPDYISSLISWLKTTGVDNVGGVCVTCPANKTLTAQAIAIALSHPFGVGNSYFRIGLTQPRHVDTVPFGCYKREVFDHIGMFDEELIRNQDDEFNLRLIKRGGRILLLPEIKSYYFARESLSKLWRMYYQYGYFKPLVIRKIGSVITIRQLVPVLFVLSLLVTGILAPWSDIIMSGLEVIIISYMAVNIGFSVQVAVQQRMRCALMLPITFLVLHLSYGLGFLRGMIDFFFWKHRRRQGAANIPLSR